MNTAMSVGDVLIGDGHPAYVVFEAGPTHDGLATAKKLVDMAAAAGANAVKFQMLCAERIVSSREVLFSYEYLVDKQSNETRTATEPLMDILKRRELTREQWAELIDHCRKARIEFFSTATSEEEMSFLAECGVGTIKICSGDINYHHLLRRAAAHDWVVQIDTGAASIAEVEEAVDVLEGSGCGRIIINHCPTGYPAKLTGINLRVLTTLKQLFPYPVAYSDHSPGYAMDTAAIALGANMIEKTITLDRTVKSPEHIMSLEFEEAMSFVRVIRDVETAFGSPRRVVSAKERAGYSVARRSLFAACDLAAGQVLTQEMLDYIRPGDGIPAHLDRLVLGRSLARPVRKGQRLDFADFQ